MHEPTFYSHTDETDWLEEDEVFLYKKSLLEKNNINVWRFHDYLHTHKPDGVQMGVLSMLGWEKFYNAENPLIVEIPAQSLEKVIEHVKSKLGISTVKYIGDLKTKVTKIALLPGAWGGKNQIETIARYNPDLTIVGELNEWETSEYVRDLRQVKGTGSLIILGHAVSEEPGMQWMVSWIKKLVPEIQVTHIAAEDPFKWK